MTTRRTFMMILAASPMLLWLSSRKSVLKSVLATTETPNNKTSGGKIRLYSVEKKDYITSEKMVRTEAEWQKILTPEQFHILRQEGTERAFTGRYWHNEEKGIYKCAGCANDLFGSETKFNSGTGWPSFWKPIAPENIHTASDSSFLMQRTEIECARCDGHLGHVFDDGPPPTGLRYCMNSASLLFVKSA